MKFFAAEKSPAKKSLAKIREKESHKKFDREKIAGSRKN